MRIALNLWSDREIIGVRWFSSMVAAFVEPSVTVLCPEHVDKLGEGAV